MPRRCWPQSRPSARDPGCPGWRTRRATDQPRGGCAGHRPRRRSEREGPIGTSDSASLARADALPRRHQRRARDARSSGSPGSSFAAAAARYAAAIVSRRTWTHRSPAFPRPHRAQCRRHDLGSRRAVRPRARSRAASSTIGSVSASRRPTISRWSRIASPSLAPPMAICRPTTVSGRPRKPRATASSRAWPSCPWCSKRAASTSVQP